MKIIHYIAIVIVLTSLATLPSCNMVRVVIREDLSSASFSYTYKGAGKKIDTDKNICRVYDEYKVEKDKTGKTKKMKLEPQPEFTIQKDMTRNCFGGGSKVLNFKIAAKEKGYYICLVTRVYNTGEVDVQNPRIVEVVPANFKVNTVYSQSSDKMFSLNNKEVKVTKSPGAGGTTVYDIKYPKPLKSGGSVHVIVTGNYIVKPKQVKK